MFQADNYSLKALNTFGIDVATRHYVRVDSEFELIDFIKNSHVRKNLKLVLGGGSNMLLTKDIDGAVLHVNIKGLQIISQDGTTATIEAGAGENWHQVVLWALENQLGGIENLSLIPGNIGTAPVQNIGAYGVEIKDTFHSLDAVHIITGEKRTFNLTDCAFGYRDSIFKNTEKGQYIISKVRLKLNKPPHSISSHYGDIENQLAAKRIDEPTIHDISRAVIAIRQSKLPDPAKIGNSGSFFKNPVVDADLGHALKQKYPGLPLYPAGEGKVKIAAGWLIDSAGWKGFRKGDAGVHSMQALVLVNYGQASGKQILELAHKIIADVKNNFGVELEAEVNVV